MTIVRSFIDAGKSGVGIQGRDALQELLRTVEGGQADFSTILVYDVSRWGRFQEPDEGAYYEFRCIRANITVQYCAEHFPTDNEPMSAVMKSLKRAMAGEYSRELSAKVFAGQCRLITLGYRQGGTPSMMEQETDELLKHADSIKANYGDDVLNLTAATKYVKRLLGNTRVHRYLAKHHEDALAALEQLLADTAADKQRRPTRPALTRKRRVTAAATVIGRKAAS